MYSEINNLIVAGGQRKVVSSTYVVSSGSIDGERSDLQMYRVCFSLWELNNFVM